MLLLAVTTAVDVLFTVQVPVGLTPPLFVNVWLAAPPNARLELPPSKVGLIVTAARPSTVPFPLLLLISPSIRFNVPAAINVLVLLNNKLLPLVLLMTMLFSVKVAGITMTDWLPTKAIVPPL